MLGFLVKQEQQEAQRKQEGQRMSTPKYSSNKQALQAYDNKLQGRA